MTPHVIAGAGPVGSATAMLPTFRVSPTPMDEALTATMSWWRNQGRTAA